jgi:hypothetical protein
MNVKSERLLRWWNGLALLLVGFLAALPGHLLPGTPPRTVGGYIFSGVGGVLLAGFWLRILFECMFGRTVRRRTPWLIFLLVFPLFSAFIYFATTRSLQYEARVRTTENS